MTTVLCEGEIKRMKGVTEACKNPKRNKRNINYIYKNNNFLINFSQYIHCRNILNRDAFCSSYMKCPE